MFVTKVITHFALLMLCIAYVSLLVGMVRLSASQWCYEENPLIRTLKHGALEHEHNYNVVRAFIWTMIFVVLCGYIGL